MTEFTRVLCAIAQRKPQAGDHRLPVVYNELQRLAAEKIA
jgi:hypothetical protein